MLARLSKNSNDLCRSGNPCLIYVQCPLGWFLARTGNLHRRVVSARALVLVKSYWQKIADAAPFLRPAANKLFARPWPVVITPYLLVRLQKVCIPRNSEAVVHLAKRTPQGKD